MTVLAQPRLGRTRLGAALGVVILAAALILRLLYVDATPHYALVHDARDYEAHAQSIAVGEGYSRRVAYGRPTAFRPPGYPYFLAGVYRLAGVERASVPRRVHAARIAQALVGTGVVALIGVLAAQLWSRRIGLAAMALGAIYLPLILVGGAVMSEPLFALWMLAALAAALAGRRSPHRYRFAVLTGILAGLAILTRANAVVLLAPLAFAAAARVRPRTSLRALGPPAALLLAAAITITPWTIRNAVQLHAFVPVSTQLGSSLAGTYNDTARTDRVDPGAWRSVGHVPQYADLWRQVRSTPEAVLERRLRAAALRDIREHPTYVATVGYRNTLRMLDLAGLRRARATAATISIDRRWADAGVVSFWVVAALALIGAASGLARGTPWFAWAVPGLMFLSVVFLAVETPRYRTAIDPFIILLAAVTLARAGRLRGPRRQEPPGHFGLH